MRNGKTFDMATTDLMNDMAWWQEQYISFQANQQYTPRNDYTGKGNGKQWNKSGSDWTPEKVPRSSGWKNNKGDKYGRQQGSPKNYDRGTSEKEPCKKYNAGTCHKDADSCTYAHKCSVCGKFGHAATDCWNKDNSKSDSQKGSNGGNKGGKSKGKGKGSKGKGAKRTRDE